MDGATDVGPQTMDGCCVVVVGLSVCLSGWLGVSRCCCPALLLVLIKLNNDGPHASWRVNHNAGREGREGREGRRLVYAGVRGSHHGPCIPQLNVKVHQSHRSLTGTESSCSLACRNNIVEW